MREPRPDGLTESLWRSARQLLLAATALAVAWSLLRPLLVPLIVVVVLLAVLRVAVGWRHRGW